MQMLHVYVVSPRKLASIGRTRSQIDNRPSEIATRHGGGFRFIAFHFQSIMSELLLRIYNCDATFWH
jgi:hypothetical protein